jgi:hypothetical protein
MEVVVVIDPAANAASSAQPPGFPLPFRPLSGWY